MSGQYDWAQRLSDLCNASESQAQEIAGEILGRVARLMNEREIGHDAVRASLSRLALAQAAMRTFLRNDNRDVLEAWLLAAQENKWLEEIKAALDKNEEADAITDQGGSA